MANKNKGKQVGEPCAYCKTPLVTGQWGAWCPPCNDKWKASKGGGQSSTPAKSNGGYSKKTMADYKVMLLSYAKDYCIGAKLDSDHIFKIADRMVEWFKGGKKAEQKPEPKKEQTAVQQEFESPLDDTDEIPF